MTYPTRLELVRSFELGALAERGSGNRHATIRAVMARSLAQSAALGRAIAVLHRDDIPALVMKGAAMAAACYPLGFRPRNDDDLLVDRAAFGRAVQLLAAAGYESEPQVTSPLITGQQHLVHRARSGFVHHVDLHWRPLNPAAFDALPDFGELLIASVPLPSLGAGALGLGRVHALLFACAHRVAHHTPTEDPLWLFDIHRLASLLRDDEWRSFAEVATRGRIAEVCGNELRRAAEVHGTRIPIAVSRLLANARGEPSARHGRSLGPLHVQWLNLRHLVSWSARLRLVRAHLIPPVAYMTARYGHRPYGLLPFLYARRVATGGRRWIAEWLDRSRS